MRSDTTAQCQADKFEEVRIPQASLIPNMAENYRCMLVWDTRTNRDVGWLMVRKKAVDGMKSDEVAAEISQCQWRNWNLNNSTEEMYEVDCREALTDPVKGIDLNKVEEASTSSESKSAAGLKYKVKVDCGVQVETEVFDATRCSISKTSGEPLSKKTKLGHLAVIESSHFDKLEVVGVSANNNENVMRNKTAENDALLMKELSEKETLTGRERKKPKNRIKTSLPEVCKVDHIKEIRKSYSSMLHECPECGKSVKQKSFYQHLRVVHNIKSAVSLCNVCNRHIMEVNLMVHREIYHPERFQFDMIACSGCQKQVRAVDFDGHECEVEDVPSWTAVGDELMKSSKCSRQDKMVETCSDCFVVFSGDEMMYHDCKISSVVRLKRLRIKSKKSAMGEVKVQNLKAGNLMCEDCGKLFNDNGRLDQHDCNETFIEEQYFELNEDDVNLALDKIGEITERKTSSNMAEILALGITKGLENVHSQAKVEPGGSLSTANVNEPKGSILPAKIIELSTSITPTKILESRCSLTSAKVVGQPPQFLRRGKVFTFTVKLLDINKNSLLIQSACLTAACRGSSVLEFRLELLQANGSITLQPLWISICSADQPAVLLKCLIPHHIPCRQLDKDQLQFSMSCDLYPGSTDYRYKLVVATNQLVLCYSREVIILTKPEQIQETNKEGVNQLDITSDSV